MAPAIFARPDNMRRAYGNFKRAGLLYGGGLEMLACQLLAAACIITWVSLTMGPFFVLFNKLDLLREDHVDEIRGLDETKHGCSAYEIELLQFSVQPKDDTDPKDEECNRMERAVPSHKVSHIASHNEDDEEKTNINPY